jgi:hypothetical protein
LRLPQPGGPGPLIYILQEQGEPVIPLARGSIFVASYNSRRYGGGIRIRVRTRLHYSQRGARPVDHQIAAGLRQHSQPGIYTFSGSAIPASSNCHNINMGFETRIAAELGHLSQIVVLSKCIPRARGHIPESDTVCPNYLHVIREYELLFCHENRDSNFSRNVNRTLPQCSVLNTGLKDNKVNFRIQSEEHI